MVEDNWRRLYPIATEVSGNLLRNPADQGTPFAFGGGSFSKK